MIPHTLHSLARSPRHAARSALGLAVVLAVALAVALAAGRAAAAGFDAFNEPVSFQTYVSLDHVPQGGTAHVAVAVQIAPPWHVNAHRLDDSSFVATDVAFAPPRGITVDPAIYPKGHEVKLGFSEGTLKLYSGTVLIGAVIHVAADVPTGQITIPATVTFQACDNEKCLIPQTKKLSIPVTISPPNQGVNFANAEIFSAIDFGSGPGAGAAAGAGSFGNRVASHGLLAMFLLVFLGGLALNLTPCVFPIIPITVSYFGGQAGGRSGRTAVLALLYLLGMAVMYSSLGLVAALTGSLFGAALQNPVVLTFVAAVMVVLALSMFGLYEIRVPMKLAGAAGTAKRGGPGAFLMGLTVGIVAAPCIGPFVLGLLTFVGERGEPVLGFLLFFTLAVGLGIPYVLLAIASGNLSKLPKSGEWMEWVRKVFGVVLLGMAAYFLRPVLGDPVFYAVMGAVLVIGGIFMGFVAKAGSAALFVKVLRRTVGLAAPLYGLYLVLAPGNIIARHADAGIPWKAYDTTILQQAVKDDRPVVIDFSADWCLPCRELEHRTFNHPDVVKAARAVVPLRADLTRSASPEVVRLRQKYDIRGVPTVVFIDGNGKERRDLRIVEFVDKDEFLRRLEQLHG